MFVPEIIIVFIFKNWFEFQKFLSCEKFTEDSFTFLLFQFVVLCDMTPYRTSMQIIGDLLIATKDTGDEGIRTTRLLAKANLSHSRLTTFLENLTGSGLVNKIEYDGKNTFVITIDSINRKILNVSRI